MQILLFSYICSETSKNDKLLLFETFAPVNKVGI